MTIAPADTYLMLGTAILFAIVVVLVIMFEE